MDLFSGCGGMSLGFMRAGFTPVAALEANPQAARNHAFNFHGSVAEEDPSRFEQLAQPTWIDDDTDPEEVLRSRGVDGVELILAGPPCPAFTRIGRAKLREVHGRQDAHLHDHRAHMHRHLVRFVRMLRPRAVVMENVPGMLSFGGVNVADLICSELEQLGYDCRYTLLNAAHFGVPQFRERLFLVAIQAGSAEFRFPAPTHHIELPDGYRRMRDEAVRLARGGPGGCRSPWIVEPIDSDPANPRAVTAKDAIGDLPPIEEHLKEDWTPRARAHFDSTARYRGSRPSDFAIDMRNWPGFEVEPGSHRLVDHVTRSLGPRDHAIFARMRPGDDYMDASRIADELREEARRERGRRVRDEHLVPPYDRGKFPNKWWMLRPTSPSRTLTAHLGKDGYSHIHFDPKQKRVISVREAARLQSFPDGFRFACSMNRAFTQIGNAVPPLLAWRIAGEVMKELQSAVPATEARRGGKTVRRRTG